ncbi:MAG: hypothetical protein ABR511_10900 [Acidimicrobiales bacterium]
MVVLIAVDAVAIAFLGLLVRGLLRSHAEVLGRLHALGARPRRTAGAGAAAVRLAGPRARRGGPAAADVVGMTPAGDPIAIGIAGTRHDTVLVFLSRPSVAADPFWPAPDPAGQRLPPAAPGGARVVVVVPGTDAGRPYPALAPEGVAVVGSDEAWRAYRVEAAPTVVYVDGPAARVVARGPARSWEEALAVLAVPAATLPDPAGG